MSATETETVSDLVQKMVISLCGDQKPGEVMFFGFYNILVVLVLFLIQKSQEFCLMVFIDEKEFE